MGGVMSERRYWRVWWADARPGEAAIVEAETPAGAAAALAETYGCGGEIHVWPAGAGDAIRADRFDVCLDDEPLVGGGWRFITKVTALGRQG